MSDPPAEVRERLLKAWRGEIIAGSVYGRIASRMEDREAEILRRMAEAEGSHRRRLEARMRELSVPVPDVASVQVPLWLRLQAKVAPIDRLLAAREAAEDEEVDDLYKRSTGDPVTDQLLREIRKEERSHSIAVQDMRSGGHAGEQAGDGAADATSPPATGAPALGPPFYDGPPMAIPGARARLRLDLGRDLRRQRRARRRVRDRGRSLRRDGGIELGTDSGARRRNRLGALDGDRGVPRRTLRDRGRSGEH